MEITSFMKMKMMNLRKMTISKQRVMKLGFRVLLDVKICSKEGKIDSRLEERVMIGGFLS